MAQGPQVCHNTGTKKHSKNHQKEFGILGAHTSDEHNPAIPMMSQNWSKLTSSDCEGIMLVFHCSLLLRASFVFFSIQRSFRACHWKESSRGLCGNLIHRKTLDDYHKPEMGANSEDESGLISNVASVVCAQHKSNTFWSRCFDSWWCLNLAMARWLKLLCQVIFDNSVPEYSETSTGNLDHTRLSESITTE